MRVVILVPRRSGFPERDRLWAYVKRWWQENLPGIDIVEGHHDHGLFNRSAAINIAAHKAGAWDVALIIDSDVILDEPQQAHDAALAAHETGKLVVAFELRHNLSRLSTEHMLNDHSKQEWSAGIERTYEFQHSSVIAVPVRLWDEIGGFDEAFRGWGMEDTAYAIAAETYGGKRITLPGVVWHLWHMGAPEKNNSPSRMANRTRLARYREADGDRAAIRALLDEADAVAHDLTIPMILHRVIPEKVSPVSEQWWCEFQALHPGWRFMTWQDPLDPEQFPITSPHWDKAISGAQLADMVRLEVLLNWGGVYVDSDVQPFRNMNPLLQAQAFAAWEDHRSIPNAVIGMRLGHPAIEECLAAVIERMPSNVWGAGPGVTTDIFRARDDVLVLPPESWFPVHYKDEDRDEKMASFDPSEHPWTYGLHWYANSWAEDPRARHPLKETP